MGIGWLRGITPEPTLFHTIRIPSSFPSLTGATRKPPLSSSMWCVFSRIAREMEQTLWSSNAPPGFFLGYDVVPLLKKGSVFTMETQANQKIPLKTWVFGVAGPFRSSQTRPWRTNLFLENHHARTCASPGSANLLSSARPCLR